MKRLGSCLIVTLLAACAGLTPQPDAGARFGAGSPEDAAQTRDAQYNRSHTGDIHASGLHPSASDRVGRVGPNGTPPPGIPQTSKVPVALPSVADRGIGGTGAPRAAAATMQTADRGIGGTGIVGVVTGFGSIFVNGIEVEYDGSATVDIDGTAASVSALRAGQLVAIQADGPATALQARTIAVRSAASGRIEALELGSGMLTIAGQPVTVPAGTWGANRFGLGDWVRVSGLRGLDGTIVASRIDPAPPGLLQVRGQVVRDGNEARVGNLVLTGQAAASVKDRQFVVLSGDYMAGRGHVSSVASDPLPANPAAYFGPATSRLVLQAFVRVTQGTVSINGLKIRSAPAVAENAAQNGIAVVSLQRQQDGSYIAVDLRYADYQGHTRQQSRSGGADASQAPQKAAHAGSPPAPAGNDIGSAAAGPVATTPIASDTYDTSASTVRTEDGVKGVTVTSVAPAALPPATANNVTGPGIASPVAVPPAVTTPTETTPVAASATPVLTSAATATPGTPETPSTAKVAAPLGAVTPAAPAGTAATGGTTPTGSTPDGTTPGGASVQSVGPPGQLISSNGGGSTSGTTAMISSNTGAPTGVWNQPRIPVALAQRAPRRPSAVIGTAISPGITQLTAAVTSETTAVSVPAAATAAVTGAKLTSATASAGKTAPPPGTNTGKAATGMRTH
jgi:hypothetical protein